MVSFKDATVDSGWVKDATVKLIIEIPHLTGAQTYSGGGDSPNGCQAVAYGTHMAIDRDCPMVQVFVHQAVADIVAVITSKIDALCREGKT